MLHGRNVSDKFYNIADYSGLYSLKYLSAALNCTEILLLFRKDGVDVNTVFSCQPKASQPQYHNAIRAHKVIMLPPDSPGGNGNASLLMPAYGPS
jgi:hypothetical protein